MDKDDAILKALDEAIACTDEAQVPITFRETLAREGFAIVARQPERELLASMALRQDHGFGLHTEDIREQRISEMRQLHEEVVGEGFYSEQTKERYADIEGKK